EYAAQSAIDSLRRSNQIIFNSELHLSVSMRSYRAEHLSKLIKQILDIDEDAKITLKELQDKYPVILTRDLNKAKEWLKEKARGSERYGLVVSSQAYRLKPLAIDVKTQINHVNWFLE